MPLVRDEVEFEAKRQQIIQGALKVFAERGFERATNKAIAEAAGIGSPGLIYHYFKDKGDLFISAITSQSPGISQIREHNQELFDLPLEQFVRYVGKAALQLWANPKMVPIVKVLLGEALRNAEVLELLNTQGPGLIFRYFQEYFAKQIELGTMRNMDPAVAVRCLLGPILGYVLAREVLPALPSVDMDVMFEQSIELFLRGVQAES
jgi:AcrR family transcriptional regulator